MTPIVSSIVVTSLVVALSVFGWAEEPEKLSELELAKVETLVLKQQLVTCQATVSALRGKIEPEILAQQRAALGVSIAANHEGYEFDWATLTLRKTPDTSK